MAERDMRWEEYGTGNGNAVAALVTGYGGKIDEFSNAIFDLIVAGHDVVAYEYSTDVLRSGDPEQLPQLVEKIRSDFAWRARNLNGPKRCTGVSLGMGIALNLQREYGERQLPAVYAAGGTNVAGMIANNVLFNMLCGDVRKAFKCKGHNEQTLREAWAPLHESPNAEFAVALGGLDRIVKYREARQTMRRWQRDGTPIKIKTLPELGHAGVINWFNRNIPEMLTLADSMRADNK